MDGNFYFKSWIRISILWIRDQTLLRIVDTLPIKLWHFKVKTNDIAKLYVNISYINIKIIQDSSQKSNEKSGYLYKVDKKKSGWQHLV